MSDPLNNTSSTGNVVQNQEFSLNEQKEDSLKSAGFSEEQINQLSNLANDEDSTLSSNQFYALDKTTLDMLRSRGTLTEQSRSIVLLQTPVAMLKQISDPVNWDGDTYIGPGAETINAYLANEEIDFSKPALEALVMAVLVNRADIVEKQLRGQIETIQEKNKQLEVMNEWLTKAKQKKTNAGTSGKEEFTSEFKDFWDSLGATYQSGSMHKSADWDVNIEGLKKEIEALTSQTQLETTKLQQTINKYNQSYELLSNFMTKYYQSVGTQTQNIRA